MEVAEVEVRQSVLGIGIDRANIEFLRFCERADIEVDRTEVHQRTRRDGIEGESLFVGFLHLLDRGIGPFKGDSPFKPPLGLSPVAESLLILQRTVGLAWKLQE